MFFIISGFFFFYFAIIGIYTIFMPKILQMYDYSAFEIGFIFSIAPLVRFLVPFFFLKHFRLNNQAFSFAIFLCLLCSVLFYFTIHSVWLFALSNVIFGIALGLILPYVETLSIKLLKKENFGKSRLYGSLGFIFSSLVLGKFLDTAIIGLHLFSVCVLAMLLFGFFVAKTKMRITTPTCTNAKLDFRANFGFWLNIFFMQVSFGAFYNFFTIYQTEHGISLEMTSWMWIFGVVCEVLLFYVQGVIIKRYELLHLVAFSTILTSFRWLLLFLFPSSILFAFFSQAFHAVGFALYHTCAFAYLQKTYHNAKQLSAQFYYGISYGLGAFCGALIAGVAYGEYLYLVASLIAFLGLLSIIPICKNETNKVEIS